MPDIDYTFQIASGETWTEAALVSSITGALYTSDGATGSTSACIRFTTTSAQTNVYERIRSSLISWEDMGVPEGAIVTDVYTPSFYTKKVASTGLTSQQNEVRLVDSSNSSVLSSELTNSGMGTGLTGWVEFTIAGQRPTVNSNRQASNTQVKLEVGWRCQTTGTVNADTRIDKFTLRITYEIPVNRHSTALTFI